MDFIDYREALQLDYCDAEKFEYFTNRMFNLLDGLVAEGTTISFDEYYTFCSDCGVSMNHYYGDIYRGAERFQHCIKIISAHRKNLKEFLLYYVWFANSLKENSVCTFQKEDFILFLQKTLENSHIQYDIQYADDYYFIFPKGAKELDNALVSQPLKWLSSYPSAQKTYITALKQYSDGIYIRDVADNLRKALETFLQEFLGNTKNLETNKTEICKYLGSNGIDAGISGLFQPLISAYKNINDRIAKHNDAVDKNILEFLLYQTGILIRMVIVVYQSMSTNSSQNT